MTANEVAFNGRSKCFRMRERLSLSQLTLFNDHRLLQEVEQKEGRLRRELYDTVEKKESISRRMVLHQVCPPESTQRKRSVESIQRNNPQDSSQPQTQSNISSLETVRHRSASLLADIKDTSFSARAASDQVSVSRGSNCTSHSVTLRAHLTYVFLLRTRRFVSLILLMVMLRKQLRESR